MASQICGSFSGERSIVVPDKIPLWVGGKGRLARPREPEEKRDVSPVLASYVGRAVHGEHTAFRRQHEVQHREDALLDLARVCRAADEDYLALVVYPDERLGFRAVLLRVR
jgi:hypothetical protein